jgi:hypothetical protein
MKKYIFLLLLAPLPLFSQTLTYDIKAVGVNAGTLVVSKKSSNGTDQYLIESHSSVNYVLGKIKVDHTTRCTYVNGILQSSYVRNEKNGDVEYYSSISYDGSTYHITNDIGKKTWNKPISFAICHIFFNEPKGQTEIFSDRFGQYIPLKKLEDHVYRLDFPDGDKITYYFENGLLVKSDLPSPVGKAHFYLRK